MRKDREDRIHPLFDKVEGLRKIYIQGIGYFIIQDPDTTYGEQESKTVQCFSSEYENANKYLESFFINTGETDSAEVIYLENKYGEGFSVDELYVRNTNPYDPYQKYYVKTYDSNGEDFTYEQVTVANESDFNTYDGSTVALTLYIKKYDNVRFYWPTCPELSLLNIIFKKIPCWKIGHVDADLLHKEYRFEEERIAVYDFMMNEMSETVGCVVVWDTIKNEVNFYSTEEDGLTVENSVQTLFDSDIFISRDNLATEINVSYSTDDIKTKLRVSGGSEDIDIRDVNLGQNYIMNLDYYNTIEWMGEDLYNAWNSYTKLLEEKTAEYEVAITQWTNAYNEYQKIKTHVPFEFNVLLVGDVFEKLYCTYTVVGDTEEAFNATMTSLQNHLKLYYTTETPEAFDSNDNLLLTLKDKNENSAKIRVKYTDGEYKVSLNKHNAANGLNEASQYFSLQEWVEGKLTAEYLGLTNYKVSSIGVLGSYLCLAKDELAVNDDGSYTTLQEYGIDLLEEKRKTYLNIFTVHTEGLFSSEKNQCVVQAEEPTENYPVGTFWLDSDDENLAFYRYTDASVWAVVDTNEALPECKNYIRFIDNYKKLQAVQKVLAEKIEQANYWQDGFYVEDFYLNRENIDKDVLLNVAQAYFVGRNIFDVSYDNDAQIYTFSLDGDAQHYAVYMQGKRPYISYANSVGASQCKMNYLTSVTKMETQFTDAQWARLSPFIREDEYSNDNILFVGNESDEEELDLRKELLEEAQKELKKICQPKLSFNMNMANILAIPEFKPLMSRFQLGNYIKVELRPGYVQRARLLEVNFSLSDFSDFNATFGNLITTKSEIDKHADLLKQAVTAGKTVASSANNWQRGADKATALDKAITDGLKDAALEVGAAYGQAISWDQYGIWGRKLVDGTTDQYEDEQFRMINNKLVFSSDGFETSKAVFGKFTIKDKDGNEQTRWGVLSDAVIAGYIEGSDIYGGTIDIGDGNFVVDSYGNVSINACGGELGNTVSSLSNTVDQIKEPIISDTPPLNPSEGMVWVDTNGNSPVLKIYKDDNWHIVNDSSNRVFTSKPDNYHVGDVWIVSSGDLVDDPIEIDGTQVKQGAILVAKQDYNATIGFQDSDWYYDQNTNYQLELQYYMQFNKTSGLTIKDTDDFYINLTSQKLGFYQEGTEVAYIDNKMLNIKEAKITDGITIGKNANISGAKGGESSFSGDVLIGGDTSIGGDTTINGELDVNSDKILIGKDNPFGFIIEPNGSLSIMGVK